MSNRLMLAQQRRAYEKHIEQSPTSITLTRFGTTEDGMGNIISDESSTVTKSYTVRISRERSQVQAVGTMPSGLDTSMAEYMLAPWDADIQENDNIGSWRVGRVSSLMKFGGVVAKEAPLIIQTNAGNEV